MALNKYFDIDIIHNSVDITEYCSIKQFPAINRNLDCTQIFDKLNLNISLLSGVAFAIKEQDLFYIRVEDTAHYYRATTIEDSSTDREIELTNIFELLEDKRFYVGEEGSEILNPLLSSFVSDLGAIYAPNLNTLLQMICTLAISKSEHYKVEFNNYTGVYDSPTIISNIGTLIYYNATFADWGKDITPAELLKLLQLEYCFSISAKSAFDTGFTTITLPTMIVFGDYTIVQGSQLVMPEFFRLDTINKLLNPVRDLDKDFYSERPTLITKKKKGIEIVDDADIQNEYFKYEYRNDVEIEEIEYPENFNITPHFTPLKIQASGSDYILKAGYYNAYHLYFSYIDIIQDPTIKLDYQVPTGYQKVEYKFTNEEGEETFENPISARKCVFDNDKFSVILTDNRIIDKNNIRG